MGQYFCPISKLGGSDSPISCILDCTKFVCYNVSKQTSRTQKTKRYPDLVIHKSQEIPRNLDHYLSNGFYESLADRSKMFGQNT